MGLSAREWLALWGWGDLSPDNMPHLRYPSVWRWVRAEGVPLPLPRIADPAERQRREREYLELWRYLFVRSKKRSRSSKGTFILFRSWKR